MNKQHSRLRRHITGGVLACLLAIAPAAAAAAAPSGATAVRAGNVAAAKSVTITRSGSCTGYASYKGITRTRLQFNFTATLSLSGSTAVVKGISYSMYVAEESYGQRVPIQNRSNVNVTGVRQNTRTAVTWNSPDSLAASGTVRPPSMVVPKGKNLLVRGIADIKDNPDPACTAAVTV